MENIPYGYCLNEGKLEVEPNEAAVISYIYEANLRYSENPPVWENATIDGRKIYIDESEICDVGDFIKGYISAEVNFFIKFWSKRHEIEPELKMSDLIRESDTKEKVRQCLTANSFKDFCSGVLTGAFGENIR